MAKIIQYFLLIVNFLQILQLTICENETNFQQRFTTKCNELCEIKSDKGVAESPSSRSDECLRGCQYFNLEFLTNARTGGKNDDLNHLVEKCGASCHEAYSTDKTKKEKCFHGCNEMMSVQATAPIINGWLVYMGATDRNMVLLQPDFDLPSKEDWILLDSMFRNNDYDYDPNTYDKLLTDDHIQSIPIYTGRQHFNINYCLPAWMWMLPLILLIGFIWIHYSNYIYGVFIREGIEHEFGAVVSAASAAGAADQSDKKLRKEEDFLVGTDFYFYPSPAIPPPRYNEAAEAILMGSSDEEDANVDEDKEVAVIDGSSKCFADKNTVVVNI